MLARDETAYLGLFNASFTLRRELVETEVPFLARSPGSPQTGRGRTVGEPPPGTGDKPAELLEFFGGEPEDEVAVGELDLAHRTTRHPPVRAPGRLPAPRLTSRSLRYQAGEVQKLGPVHRDAHHPPAEPDDAVIFPRYAAARVVGGQHGGPKSRVHPLSIHSRRLFAATAFAQLAIQQEQGGAIFTGHPQPLDDVGGVLLFFYLLRDEPAEQDLRRVVVLPHRELVEVVDAGGYLLLVFQGLLEGIERGPEGVGRLFYGPKLNGLAAIQQELEELHGVLQLLPALLAHPVGEPREVGHLERPRHREVQVGGVELVLDLLPYRIPDRALHRRLRALAHTSPFRVSRNHYTCLPGFAPYSPGLRSLQYGIDDRGGGSAERIGGGEAGLVRYPRDELLGSGIIETPGVDAHGDHGCGLDEGGDLLVEPGGVGGCRGRYTGEHLFVRRSGAEDQAVRTRAVQKPQRDPGVGRVAYGALALDQDQARPPSRRLEHQLLRGAGDEVRDDGVHADAPPGDDDARLPRRDELGPYGRLPGRSLNLQARRHLAYSGVRPDGEGGSGLHLETGPGEERDIFRRLAHVPDRPAGELWGETLVEAAHDLQPGPGGLLQGLHPLGGQPPARRGEPDQDGGRRVLQNLLERTDYRDVALELRHNVAHASPRQRRVDDGDDFILAISNEAVGGLGVAVAKVAFGQDRVAAPAHRGPTPSPASSERRMRPSS